MTHPSSLFMATLPEYIKRYDRHPTLRAFALKHFLRGAGAASGVWLAVLYIILGAR